jgi:cytochrome bd-type quinol oxidase subunit 2
MLDPIFSDALRYWETRRVAYNLALVLLAAAWVVMTWPHFKPAFRWDVVPKLVALAAIANVCYCAAYLVDVPAQHSAGATWRRRRWILWASGTLFALLIACYWIADEIYPFVDAP